jgi:catechol 2,3-dioxygenase-like lactoylglutathione lyase family enzyme
VPVRRLDHVNIVARDLDAMTAFFLGLGLEVVQEKTTIDDEWAARVQGIEGARSEIVMVATPDGQSRLELQRYVHPPASGGGAYPANTLGITNVAFEVDDLAGMLADLDTRGFGLVGHVENYADTYELCYVRGPEGIIVMLAERLD